MLTLLGLNHRSAPVDLRERLAFQEEELPDLLRRLVREPGVTEAMILSTCNRVELLARTDPSLEGARVAREFLARERGVRGEEIERHSYTLQGLDSVRHVFHVASGLDSMVLGEPQILGQVKDAYALARDAGTSGPVLDHLMQRCLATAKRVRTETGISRNAVSVSFAAVTLARKIFGELDGRSALLLGAGKMTELAARHLVGNGVGHVTVTNRTFSRAVALAQEIGGEAVPWDDRLAQFEHVDIVITGTAALEPVVLKAHIQKAMRARHGRPLFLVDIAVPRDVEPAVNDVDNVYLYDIDDLQGVVDTNLEERRRAADQARRMIDDEVGAFARWRQTQEVVPAIAALQEHLHRVGRDEIERFRRKLSTFNEDQHQTVEELTRAVIQKILHPAIRSLKASAERGEAAGRTSLYREIFGFATTPQAETEPATPAAEGPAPSSSEKARV